MPLAPSRHRPGADARRFASIDGLRLVAAMGVVFYHYAEYARNETAIALVAKNYLFADFFFAISGFVIYLSYGERLTSVSAFGDFLKNRLARVYPLHLVTLLAFGLLAITVWRDKADRAFVDSAAFLPNLLMIHAWGTTSIETFNFPSWSISAEWLAYLLAPFLFLIVRRGALASLALVALIVAALEIAQARDLIGRWTQQTFHFGALRALPTFILGALIARCLADIPFRLKSFTPAWLAFGAGVAAMAGGLDDRLIIALLVLCLAAAALAERDGASGVLTRPVTTRLADASYALYMTHPLMAIVCFNVIDARLLHLSDGALLAWCAFCAIVPNLLLATIVYRWFETPTRKWMRGMRFARPGLAPLAAPSTRDRC